jgi:hypothetical protein
MWRKDEQTRGASMAGAARDRAAATMQAQNEGLADRLQDVARAVHRSSRQLEGHQDWIAVLVERGADQLTTLANTLPANDLCSVTGSLEDLSWCQPALFVGASPAAEFASARTGQVAAAGASRADLPHKPAPSQEAHAPEMPREREQEREWAERARGIILGRLANNTQDLVWREIRSARGGRRPCSGRLPGESGKRRESASDSGQSRMPRTRSGGVQAGFHRFAQGTGVVVGSDCGP